MFFILQVIALMWSQVASLLMLVFEYRIYKNAMERRGMSLYALVMVGIGNLVLVVVGGFYLGTEDVLVPGMKVVFVWWKLRQLGEIELIV